MRHGRIRVGTCGIGRGAGPPAGWRASDALREQLILHLSPIQPSGPPPVNQSLVRPPGTTWLRPSYMQTDESEGRKRGAKCVVPVGPNWRVMAPGAPRSPRSLPGWQPARRTLSSSSRRFGSCPNSGYLLALGADRRHYPRPFQERAAPLWSIWGFVTVSSPVGYRVSRGPDGPGPRCQPGTERGLVVFGWAGFPVGESASHPREKHTPQGHCSRPARSVLRPRN